MPTTTFVRSEIPQQLLKSLDEQPESQDIGKMLRADCLRKLTINGEPMSELICKKLEISSASEVTGEDFPRVTKVINEFLAQQKFSNDEIQKLNKFYSQIPSFSHEIVTNAFSNEDSQCTVNKRQGNIFKDENKTVYYQLTVEGLSNAPTLTTEEAKQVKFVVTYKLTDHALEFRDIKIEENAPRKVSQSVANYFNQLMSAPMLQLSSSRSVSYVDVRSPIFSISAKRVDAIKEEKIKQYEAIKKQLSKEASPNNEAQQKLFYCNLMLKSLYKNDMKEFHSLEKEFKLLEESIAKLDAEYELAETKESIELESKIEIERKWLKQFEDRLKSKGNDNRIFKRAELDILYKKLNHALDEKDLNKYYQSLQNYHLTATVKEGKFYRAVPAKIKTFASTLPKKSGPKSNL